MMNDPTSDIPTLRGAIQAIQPTDSRGSYAELSRALRSIAQSAHMPVEAHLFSDMQKSSWPSNFADVRLADGTKLVFHPVADKRLPNFAVENVNAPRESTIRRRCGSRPPFRGYGAAKATKPVSLVLNGKELASKQVEVPAGGRATVEFLTLDAPFGMNQRRNPHRRRPTTFPADDHFYFSVERADPRHMLFVHEDRQPARVALLPDRARSRQRIRLRTGCGDRRSRLANVSPAKYAFVVLSDVGIAARRLSRPRCDNTCAAAARCWSRWVRNAAQRTTRSGVRRAYRRDALRLARWRAVPDRRYLDPAHPAVRRSHQWDSVKFYQAVRVEPGKSKVVARLSDDTPLLLDKQIGEGRVLRVRLHLRQHLERFSAASVLRSVRRADGELPGWLDDARRTYTVGRVPGTASGEGARHDGGGARSERQACAYARRSRPSADASRWRARASTISAARAAAMNWWR